MALMYKMYKTPDGKTKIEKRGTGTSCSANNAALNIEENNSDMKFESNNSEINALNSKRKFKKSEQGTANDIAFDNYPDDDCDFTKVNAKVESVRSCDSEIFSKPSNASTVATKENNDRKKVSDYKMGKGFLSSTNFSTQINRKMSTSSESSKDNIPSNVVVKENTADSIKMEHEMNRVVKIISPRKLKIKEYEIPNVGDYQVLVRMDTVGICGSDAHTFDKGISCYHVQNEAYTALGHEGSGIVEEIGKCVRNLKVGDNVVVEPHIPCLECIQCRLGRYNLCDRMQFNALLSSFTTHSSNFCHKLPVGVDLEHAALIQPLALALRACDHVRINSVSNVVIFGACPLGLTALMAARANDAGKIMVIDSLDYNLKKAYELCADKILKVSDCMQPKEMSEQIIEKLKSQPSIVIDCCGCTTSMTTSINVLEKGGTHLQLGCHAENIKLHILNAMSKEISIKTSFRSSNKFPEAIELVKTGRAPLAKLITHKFELKDTQKAFETILNGTENQCIRAVVKFNDDDCKNESEKS